MTTNPKLKISVTLAADIVARIDRQATAEGGSRSAVIEQLLRRAATTAASIRLEESTAAYYDSLTDAETQDDEALARASARAARRLAIDDVAGRAPARPRSRRVG